MQTFYDHFYYFKPLLLDSNENFPKHTQLYVELFHIQQPAMESEVDPGFPRERGEMSLTFSNPIFCQIVRETT